MIQFAEQIQITKHMLGLSILIKYVFDFSVYIQHLNARLRSGRSQQKKLICAAMLAVIGIATGVGSVAAQTQYEIQSSKPNLEQEYREELDKWMLRAYEGDRDAQFKVGVLFTNDQFDQPDYEQAVYWYKQASRQGHVLAQYNLGHQYLTGVGVTKNETTAMQWWLEAAKQDHSLAQFNIGRAYYLGIGLTEDHAQAKYWFERAAFNQEPKSIDILKQLGWYSGELASKPINPDSSADNNSQNSEDSAAQDSIVSQSQQNEPEPIEKIDVPTGEIVESSEQDNDQPSADASDQGPVSDSNIELTSRITPIVASGTLNPPTDNAALADSVDESEPLESTADVDAAVSENTNTDNITATSIGEASNEDNNISEATGESATESEEQNAAAEIAASEEVYKSPIALYTNPEVRSVLIAILDNKKEVSISKAGDEWSEIVSANGFPVWIHGDFLKINSGYGLITGQAVNARSVPIITNGTVVGKLNKGERVAVLDKRKAWYRILAPNRFKAWVKTEDFNREEQPLVSSSLNSSEGGWRSTNNVSPPASVLSPADSAVSGAPISNKSNLNRSENDNEWLFSQAPDNYTLQLASFDDPAKIEAFVSRQKFINNPELHRFTANGKNIEWTYFLYGSYTNRAEAETSKLNIKQKLAWIRTFGRLQQNRCVAWKTQLPTPKELNRYCTQ